MTDTSQPSPFAARLLGATHRPRYKGVSQAVIERWRLNIARDLISRCEMARLLGIHRDTVYRMLRDGTIPLTPKVINGEPYYDRAGFNDWLAGQEQAA